MEKKFKDESKELKEMVNIVLDQLKGTDKNKTVDGQWSHWSIEWPECRGQREMINGTWYAAGPPWSLSRTRSCDSPSPSNGGNGCVGSRVERKSCVCTKGPNSNNMQIGDRVRRG